MAPQGPSGLQRTRSRTWPPACPRGPQAYGERGGSPRSGVITSFNTDFFVGAALSTKDLISSGKVPTSPNGHQHRDQAGTPSQDAPPHLPGARGPEAAQSPGREPRLWGARGATALHAPQALLCRTLGADPVLERRLLGRTVPYNSAPRGSFYNPICDANFLVLPRGLGALKAGGVGTKGSLGPKGRRQQGARRAFVLGIRSP